jgi:hypothetical protein
MQLVAKIKVSDGLQDIDQADLLAEPARKMFLWIARAVLEFLCVVVEVIYTDSR